jgi:DNA-binding sugar fermentation-stimulating protein
MLANTRLVLWLSHQVGLGVDFHLILTQRAQLWVAFNTQAHIRWISTAPMREELSRVLGYPHIAKRMDVCQRNPDDLLRDFDTHSQQVEIAPRSKRR